MHQWNSSLVANTARRCLLFFQQLTSQGAPNKSLESEVALADSMIAEKLYAMLCFFSIQQVKKMCVSLSQWPLTRSGDFELTTVTQTLFTPDHVCQELHRYMPWKQLHFKWKAVHGCLLSSAACPSWTWRGWRPQLRVPTSNAVTYISTRSVTFFIDVTVSHRAASTPEKNRRTITYMHNHEGMT